MLSIQFDPLSKLYAAIPDCVSVALAISVNLFVYFVVDLSTPTIFGAVLSIFLFLRMWLMKYY